MNEERKPPVALPKSQLFETVRLLKKSIDESPLAKAVEAVRGLGETLHYGAPLTDEQRREISRQRQLALEDAERAAHGRVLTVWERREYQQRAAELAEAEKETHEAKLKAIRAQTAEANEQAEAAEKRAMAIKLAMTIPTEKSGPHRTLAALKNHPNGLTVQELGPLTKKDIMAEETPRGSLDAWLKQLERGGYARHNDDRPQKWFHVKDFES